MSHAIKNRCLWVLIFVGSVGVSAAEYRGVAPIVVDAVRPLAAGPVEGLLGERLDLWREHRLWRVGRDPFLLDGFKSPPGKHPWQGEHVGKWLHAATLAYQATGDERIKVLLRETVDQLIDAQDTEGYLGTYAPQRRFYNPDDTLAKGSWDVWTHRYLIYGLLVYDRLFHDHRAVACCVRMGDLLMASFGPGKRDITSVGTRNGLSTVVLLESMVMLYERTGEERFLRFAENIVDCIERNPRLRLSAVMRDSADVSIPGDGKAYQLMATFLGYAELYRHTGEHEYLDPVLAGWDAIRERHLYETGGPWSFKSNDVRNHECFTPSYFYHPTNCVETCSTTTWIQLSLLLWRITGEARFAAEAERAIFNHLIGAQSPNGNDWAYFTMPNQPQRGYKDEVTCCASSGPRALEMIAQHLSGTSGRILIVNSYLSRTVPLAELTGREGELIVEGNYPFEEEVTLRADLAQPTRLTLDLNLPIGVKSMQIEVDGERQNLERRPSGYYRLARLWKPGDTVRITFEFLLSVHFHGSREGTRWMSFMRGPIVLAQDVAIQTDQPQVVLAVKNETEDASQWIEPADSRSLRSYKHLQPLLGKVPVYKIKGDRNIILIPYYLAGSFGGGVRTMFPTLHEDLSRLQDK
ncbi:MAG: glycoside hydrolase family 127 protein [Sedimentisphaerales bacterium]|nr:glycoside hydrolase family 127 protein [Sedimentisphaerales bacterium]